ncbi:MAG: hypothetical protein AAGI28_04195 [Pseudomonadota bacterium]
MTRTAPIKERILCLTLTAMAATALQGCVAAAIPIAAGGLVGERTISGPSIQRATFEPSVEVQTADSATQLINSDLTPVEEETRSAIPPATSVSADFNAAFVEADRASMPDMTSANETAAITSPTPIQPPVDAAAPAQIAAPAAEVVRPLPTPVPSAREPFGPSGINQLLSYANQRQLGSEEEPSAAMLSDRISLEPVKATCGGVSPTILIDLDPEGGLFDSTAASRPPSGLARGLAQLRESGVDIAWISGNGMDKLDAVTRSLKFSGLDLYNKDRVLLVRSPDDRKQALREELSQVSCLIAIAGDTRSDFDELYDYLKNPADADSLEPLIGDGWFIIPQPLL